jgi:hypothetical protein
MIQVHVLVCENIWIIEMHGATIKVILTMSLLSSICVFRQALKDAGWFLFSFLSEKQDVSSTKHLLSLTRSPQYHRTFDVTFLSNRSTCSISSVYKCSELYFWNLTSTDLRKSEFLCLCLPCYVCVTIKAEYRNWYILCIADFLLPQNLYIYNLIRNSIILNLFLEHVSHLSFLSH